MVAPPTPWPRLQDSWWVYALAGVAVTIFPFGLVVQVRCELRRCPGSLVDRILSLDGIGGLPRLYTTGLFLAVAVVAVLAVRRAHGSARPWWAAVAAIGAALALAKLVSVHSAAKDVAPLATLVGGAVLTVAALAGLSATGRRWGVAAAGPVVLALGVYAAMALGVDAVTSLLLGVQQHVGAFSRAAATFVEEFGEAAAALFLLVTVRWQLPPDDGHMPGRTSPQRQA